MTEHPGAKVTVVVDATFGHRIAKKEVSRYDEGIANNELVAPPAGAVGRGDAFVLSIADKANASVLSNDSFQEFHGDYEWLFDEGRLIGGKPVPHVGWVFVDRVPVRGPVSRKATSSGKSKSSSSGSKTSGRRSRRSSKKASEPMPVPTEPPPGRGAKPTPEESDAASSKGSRGRAPRRGEPVNELLPFLEFVEHHPVGTSINGTVDAYSSHGAYISIGDEGVRGYIPLRLMADPPPRSARQAMKVGESVTAVVVSFAPARRSIDCALPDMAQQALADSEVTPSEVAEAAAAAADDVAAPTGGGEPAAPEQPPSAERPRKRSTKKAPAKKKAATKKAPAKKKAATKKAPAKKKAAAKKAPAKKKAATKKAPAKKKAATKKAPAKKKATGRKRAGSSPSADRPDADDGSR
jgi:hypothetical protein